MNYPCGLYLSISTLACCCGKQGASGVYVGKKFKISSWLPLFASWCSACLGVSILHLSTIHFGLIKATSILSLMT